MDTTRQQSGRKEGGGGEKRREHFLEHLHTGGGGASADVVNNFASTPKASFELQYQRRGTHKREARRGHDKNGWASYAIAMYVIVSQSLANEGSLPVGMDGIGRRVLHGPLGAHCCA